MQNARFWDRVGRAKVKITLKPNTSLSWSRFTRTDDGYLSSTLREVKPVDGGEWAIQYRTIYDAFAQASNY